jgi:IS5 family transposase
MMVQFRKCLAKGDNNRINELIAERGKAMMIEVISSLRVVVDSDDPESHAGTQISLDDFLNQADWP